MSSWLDHPKRARWIEAVIFLCGFLSALIEFARRNFTVLINDEWAYLLQIDTLLRGHLKLPAPAIPEFFEAPQILVVPVYAAKYYPGQAAILAPFAAIGAPWIWPCICLAASGLLLYRIARLSGITTLGSIAAAMTLFIVPASTNVLPSLLSHATTTLLFLALVYYFLYKPRTPFAWLFGGALIAICMLTRPLDSLALAFAAGLFALFQGEATLREKLGRLLALGLPIAAGLYIVILYNRHLTGDLRLSPWTLWARQYTPFDGLGIGPIKHVESLRKLPAQIEYTASVYRKSRLEYTWAVFGKTILGRLLDWAECLPSPLLLPLVPLGLIQLRKAPRALWLLALSGLLFLLQLGFHATAVQYISELVPGLGLIVGLGIDWLQELWKKSAQTPRAALATMLGMGAAILLFTTYARDIDLLTTSYVGDMETMSIAAVLVFTLAALVLIPTRLGAAPRLVRPIFAAFLAALFLLSPIDLLKIDQRRWGPSDTSACYTNSSVGIHCLAARQARFEERLNQVRAQHGLVFVSPRTRQYNNQEYPLIDPGLGIDNNMPVIVATDLGARDIELQKQFPDRPAFRLNERLELEKLSIQQK